MSDRRAVSAGHLGASSVAAANEPWRVAVGGNRVENMTVGQIAQAFQSGHLNVRTPLWPPGTTGWQALGNFEQFQGQPQGGAGYGNPGHDNSGYDNSGYGNAGGLSQFEEADDDPTRMWTGAGDIELPGMQDMQPPPMHSSMQQQRPSARTGPRQVSRPAPSQAAPSQFNPPPPPPAPVRSAPVPSQPAVSARPAPLPMPMPPPAPSLASRTPALIPSSASPYRQSRGNGLMLVAGLVGLVGLGSAILAARGNWGSASEPAPSTEVAAAEPVRVSAPAAERVAEAPQAAPAPAEAPAAAAAKVEGGEAQLAKYEDSTASAFVAGESASKAAAKAAKAEQTEKAEAEQAEAVEDEPKANAKKRDRQDAEPREPAAKAEKAVKSARSRNEEPTPKRVASRAAPKRAVVAAALPRQKPAPAAPPPPRVEKAEKAEVAEAPQAPANAAVNEAAASALANSANLASSCRPRGGPAGAGKARVIYSNDGEVQSVEILTAKFRDTLTGSCVRMVFRRAKIPAFKGEPPTFIKSFTIPEE